jgi:hypothetical protein
MQNIGLVLLVFAFVCAVLAATWNPGPLGRWHLGWAAVAFWIAAELFGGLASHLGLR